MACSRGTLGKSAYRESEVFKGIRRTAAFKGRCGRCGFKEICGGSRARAYARYGDYLAEDPACNYLTPRQESAV
jgi:radical SAM protein with 4Fe4S-binding SPASM domain